VTRCSPSIRAVQVSRTVTETPVTSANKSLQRRKPGLQRSDKSCLDSVVSNCEQSDSENVYRIAGKCFSWERRPSTLSKGSRMN
jgi:hypothetical protein